MIFIKGPVLRRAGVGAAITLCALACPSFCRGDRSVPEQPPLPALRIDVASLGYMRPSDFYLSYRLSSMSMGFFDNDRLLFTFRVGGLLRRVPSDRPDDEDQQIRALVLDVRTGRVLKQTEWRMHDRNRYLWAYPDSRFLVRIRDSLYLAGPSLQLLPYLSSDTTLRLVETSPDRSLTLIETDTPGGKPEIVQGDGAPIMEQPVDVELLPSGSRKPILLSNARSAAAFPLMDDGMLEFLEGRSIGDWVLQEVFFRGKSKMIAHIGSVCRPSLQPISSKAVLVMGCSPNTGAGMPVYAIAVGDGSLLWQQQWESKYVWGFFDYAVNGSRFAYESIEVNRPVSVFDTLDPEDIIRQLVGVYDTGTGRMELLKDTVPVLTAGQNIALSPDGSRFAVLRNGAIEIYNLPPLPAAPAKTPLTGPK